MSLLYPKGAEGILNGSIDMTGDIRLMLVKEGYAFDVSHETISDMGNVDNGRSKSLEETGFKEGLFSAADTMITAQAAVRCTAVVIFHNGSGRLIAYIDQSAGLPCTPAAGQNVKFHFNNRNIFKL